MKNKLVLVDWQDSCFDNDGWRPVDSPRNGGVSRCQSVGFLIKKNKKEVSLCLNRSETTGQVSDLISIPRKCITSIKELMEK